MSDKRNRANPRRAFPTWLQALYLATCYGGQTGVKWCVYAVGDLWRIRRTTKPYQHQWHKSAEHVQRWNRYAAMLGRTVQTVVDSSGGVP